LNKPDLRARAGERGLDLADRPRVDGFAARLWVMSRADPGMMTKGILAGWGIDIRDPTADKRLAEYCLGLPTAAFFADGVPRALAKHALADRVPQIVLNERRRGYQFADWHEGLTAARAEMAAEIDRVGACAPAARLLDIERMRRLVEDWPTGGWERCDVTLSYRHALLRGISAGHFLRKAMGANP
jgi:asparagine synthase (glutamine-hydrolysing)